MNLHLSQYIWGITAYTSININHDFLLLKCLLCTEPLMIEFLSPNVLMNHPPLNISPVSLINIFTTITWIIETSWFRQDF